MAARSSAKDLATVNVKIMAGSSEEGRYLGSGISHFVEHMVFKGTRTRPPGEIEREIKSYGGFINGSASLDLVDYHITLPSGKIPQALAILKDMLLNAVFDPVEIERERQVILKEMRLKNDDPQSKLFRILSSTAYRAHPYRHPTIGHETLFKNLSRDDLVGFYNSAYLPNKMVITVVGDIDPNEVIKEVEGVFRDFRISAYGNTAPPPVEPMQIDKRTYTEEADTTLAYLALGFHSTSLTDEDLYALDILSIILGRGDNSRLNTALYKAKQLVYSVASANYTPRDPGIFLITAILDPKNADEAYEAIFEEVNKLKTGPVTEDELEAARRSVLADYIYKRDTTEGMADDISSNYMLTGSADFAERYLNGVRAVSKDDIRRVANKYLKETNLSEVRLVPRGTIPGAVKASGLLPLTADRFDKITLANGLRIVLYKNPASPSVSVTVAMLGGCMVETDSDNGISGMTARMLFKGTRSRKQHELLGAIQNMGGDADSFSGMSSFGFTIKSLKENLDDIIAISKDVLVNATFPEGELDKERSRTIAMIQEEDDDIFTRGLNAIRKNVFPGSPYGLRYLGSRESVAKMSRSDLVDFYTKYFTGGNMVIAMSGDIDVEPVRKKLSAVFSDIRKGGPVTGARIPGTPLAASSETITMERQESLVIQAFRSAGLKDDDRYPLEVLGSVLSGQSGRIFSGLRDKLGLAYALGCVQKLSMDTGFFAFYAATSKEMIPEVKKALAEEILDARKKPMPEEEIAIARLELSTKYRVEAQSNEYISSTGALEELCGLGCDRVFSYVNEIEKVTAADVHRVAEEYIDPGRSAEVVISPQS